MLASSKQPESLAFRKDDPSHAHDPIAECMSILGRPDQHLPYNDANHTHVSGTKCRNGGLCPSRRVVERPQIRPGVDNSLTQPIGVVGPTWIGPRDFVVASRR
jgi:hypothetical protein